MSLDPDDQELLAAVCAELTGPLVAAVDRASAEHRIAVEGLAGQVGGGARFIGESIDHVAKAISDLAAAIRETREDQP